jgi:FkbM family methyltransferase
MTGLDFFTKVYPATAPLTILDIGSHVGESVSSFLTLFPNAHVHAFEPAPDNFRRLEDTFANQPAVSIHPDAIGAFCGNVQLHLNNYDATHSVLPINPHEINRWADSADVTETNVVTVSQRSIDIFLTEAGLKTVDILKMDVQGGELLALQGAQQTLAAHRVGCIFTEVEFRALYSDQPLAWDIHAFLANLGYQFINFAGPKITDGGLLSWADAIYVNPTIWAQLAEKHSAGKTRN